MVIFVGVVLFLLAAAFLFLRIYGIPGPVLRDVVRRANAAGIPVTVDRITLTLNGWRADNVSYYSLHPDDLEPLFHSDHVFFSVRNSKAPDAASEGWNVDVLAKGLDMNPSVTWGVNIPEGSASRHADLLAVSLGFRPDRVVLSNGTMQWLGSRFTVNGTILKGKHLKRKKELPVFVNAQQFQTLEDRLDAISLPQGATVDIDFHIDMADFSANRVNFSIKAEHPSVRGIVFSEAELSGDYAYPKLQIHRAGLSRGKDSFWLKGSYDFGSKLVEGGLENSFSDNELMRLFPDQVSTILARIGVRIDQLPQLKIDFGPARIKELANHLAGSFSIRDLTYKDLELDSVTGHVQRKNGRVDFSELHVVAAGQEAHADETGSAMHGGFAKGTVFWDQNKREFGVDVDASLDPNILVGVLSRIRVATNIIKRFSFKDRPPTGHVAVGMVLHDRETFYINITAKGSNAVFQGVGFDSLAVVQTYRQGKVNLDPVVGMQGSNSIKGSVLLDIHHSTATFDVKSGINPADVEDLINPKLNIFEKHIGVTGRVQVDAKGVFDWKSMHATRFLATVQADQVGLPIARLDQFSAKVSGTGSVIAINDADFGLYGGKGEGKLSFLWNPGIKNLPYKTNLTFSNVDVRRLLLFLKPDETSNISGKLAGNAQVEADFSTNFNAVAKGNVYVKIDQGQLAYLPLFKGFSRVMRKVFPAFKVFSITSLEGNFVIADGLIATSDAFFGGDLISAKGQGCYSSSAGYDAIVQVQMLRDSYVAKVVRVITDPVFKLFKLRLTGTPENPSWKLENF